MLMTVDIVRGRAVFRLEPVKLAADLVHDLLNGKRPPQPRRDLDGKGGRPTARREARHGAERAKVRQVDVKAHLNPRTQVTEGAGGSRPGRAPGHRAYGADPSRGDELTNTGADTLADPIIISAKPENPI